MKFAIGMQVLIVFQAMNLYPPAIALYPIGQDALMYVYQESRYSLADQTVVQLPAV